jgi:hypothetical protein
MAAADAAAAAADAAAVMGRQAGDWRLRSDLNYVAVAVAAGAAAGGGDADG